MKRTNLTLVVIVFVLAAALLPQALFAQSYTVCADDNSQSCVTRHADYANNAGYTPARHSGPAARRTVCGDDANPATCTVRSAQPYAGYAPQRATAYGAADVHPSVTAGAVGLGQAQPAPHRHAPSGGYGPHYAEQ